MPSKHIQHFSSSSVELDEHEAEGRVSKPGPGWKSDVKSSGSSCLSCDVRSL